MSTADELGLPMAVDEVETAIFDGEAVVLHVPSRTVHRLGAIAAAVFMLCDGTTTVDAMVDELGAAFGYDAAIMTPLVREALAHLGSEGLLRGTAPPNRFTLERANSELADGTPVLTPPQTSADPDEPVVGDLALRIDEARPTLVVLRFLDSQAAEWARTVFAEWVDGEVDATSMTPSFTLTTGSTASEGGVRSVPQLRFGSVAMARSRIAHGPVHALAAILGGLHSPPHRAGHAQVALRPFATPDGVVLVALDRPGLVNDPMLAAHGITETSAWSVGIDDDGVAVMPEPLPSLHWTRAGLPPAPAAPSAPVRAVVLCGDDSPAEAVAALAVMCSDPRWFRLLERLRQADRLLVARRSADVRAAIRSVLER